MTSATRRYSLAHPPPVEGQLDGRETAHEAEILEMQALQAECDGEGGRSVLLMERALQIRCQVVSQLRERWATASAVSSPAVTGGHRMSLLSRPDSVSKDELLALYQAQSSELYDAAERLVVRCNALGVETFKRDAFAEAAPLLEYAMQLTEEAAYPLCEVEERRRHLRGVTLNNLGCMERRRGHFSEALQYMKSSMEMTGVESPVAYMNTSAILIQLRLSDEAVRMAERAIELLYQTPEEPSLLAVAHHNLAMALEPVDPARCLEEYALAHRTACSTLGPESETSRSIQRSRERYEATRAPPAAGRFLTPAGNVGTGAAASRLRGLVGAASTATAGVSPTRNGKAGKAGGSPVDMIELFPHPFLPSASAPAAAPKLPRDVTPIYRPTAVPRRPLAPPPPAPSQIRGSSPAGGRTRQQAAPPPHAPNSQTRRAPEKAMRPLPLPPRTAAAAPRQTAGNRSQELAAASASATGSTGSRTAAAAAPRTPTPPAHVQAQPSAAPASTRRYSPSTRTQETRQQSPPRRGGSGSSRGATPSTNVHRQRRLSESRPTASHAASTPATGTNVTRRDKPAMSRSSPERVVAQGRTPTPPSMASNTQTASSRVPQRPGRDASAVLGASSSSHAPPRNLPPLQSATTTTASAAAAASSSFESAGPGAAALRSSTTRRARETSSVTSHHDGGSSTNGPLPRPSASRSLDSDPLTFLQQRLDILLQDENELEHKYAQAIVIQRHYRGHLARRRAAALRTNRARETRLAELRRSMAARRIQRAFRRHHRHHRHRRYPLVAGQLGRFGSANRRGAQHQAATQLQRIARGWLARRHYAKMRTYARESPAAARRIQRWVRARQARGRYEALRRAQAEEEAAAVENERRQYAATRIQGQWRTYRQRKICKVALQNRMMARAAEDARRRVKAAIRIQSAWRGYQARRLYSDTYSRTSHLRAARLEYEQLRQAAVRLQAFGRMLIARHDALPLLTAARFRAAAEIQVRSREGRAATRIQCAYRSHVARRVCASRRAARAAQVREALMTARASMMQRAGRGYMARREVGATLAALQAEAERYERRLREVEFEAAVARRVAEEAAQAKRATLCTREEEDRYLLEASEEKQRTQLCALAVDARSTAAATTAQRAAKQSTLPTLAGFADILVAKKERVALQSARDAYLDSSAELEAAAHQEASARVVTAFMRGAAARKLLRSRAALMESYHEARALQEEAQAAAAASEESGDEAAPAAEAPCQTEAGPAEKPFERTPSPSPSLEEGAAEEGEANPLGGTVQRAAEGGEDADVAEPRPRTAEELAAERAALDRLGDVESTSLPQEVNAQPRRLTPQQIAEERAAFDALEARERAAAEQRNIDGHVVHQRPLTAEQIAAERVALDTLEAKLQNAAEQPTTNGQASPKRPLTAAQIAAERAALDRLEARELETEAPQPLVGGAAPLERPLTAEQMASERTALDALEERERLAAEAHNIDGHVVHQRPLTAEQIVAERAALDALEAKEHEAAEARNIDGRSPCRRPLTAEPVEEQLDALDPLGRAVDASSGPKVVAITVVPAPATPDTSEAHPSPSITAADGPEEQAATAEQAKDVAEAVDAGESSTSTPTSTAGLAADMMARQKAVWQAELAAEKKQRQQREALQQASFDYKQQRIAAAEEVGELAPYRKGRIRIEKRTWGPSSDAGGAVAAPDAPAVNIYRLQREAQEKAAVLCIERHVLCWAARRYLASLQQVRDDYIATMQQRDHEEGPMLVTACLRDVLARYPDLHPRAAARKAAALAAAPPPQAALPSPPPAPAAPSAAAVRTLGGFVMVLRAKRERAALQSARDAYLDSSAELEAAAHQEASARVVTAFMRGAAARKLLRSRAALMESYHEARALQEEAQAAAAASEESGDEAAPAAEVVGRKPFASTSQQSLSPEKAAAERSALDHLERLEDSAGWLLHGMAEQQVVAERLALDQLESLDHTVTERGECERGPRVEFKQLSAAVLRDQKNRDARRQADEADTPSISSAFSSAPRAAPQRPRLTSGEARTRLWVFAKTVQDKRDLRARQAARDAYLRDLHRADGSSFAEQEERSGSVGAPAASRTPTPLEVAGSVRGESVADLSASAVGPFDPDWMQQLYAQERRHYASQLLSSFASVAKSRLERARRQAQRDAYLDGCAEEDEAALVTECANTIARFLRSAAARNAVRSRVEALEAYNEARAAQEVADAGEDVRATGTPLQPRPPSAAARKIQRFVRGAQARQQAKEQQAVQSAPILDEEEERAVAALLNDSALSIQRLYRGHLARRRAAMATVQRDLYLLSLSEEEEAEAERTTAQAAAAASPSPASAAAAPSPPAEQVPSPDLLSHSSSTVHAASPKGAAVPAPAPAQRSVHFAPRSASSSEASALPETTSTAIVTEVDEANEASLEQVLRRR